MKTCFTFLSCWFISHFVIAQGLSLPYSTGFDSAPEQAGWQQYRTGFLSTYNWGYTGGAFSAPTCVSHDYNVGGNATDTVIDWFISPPLNFTNAGTMSLKVQTGGFSTPFPDSFEILVGTNQQNPTTGNFTVIGNLSFMLPQYQWLDTSIYISTISDSVYIALKYKTIGAAWSTYSFDNISFALSPASMDPNPSSDISIYPNPFKSFFSINSTQSLQNAKIDLFSLTGQHVIYINEITGNSVIIPRNELSNGIYFYTITEGNKIIDHGKIVAE